MIAYPRKVQDIRGTLYVSIPKEEATKLGIKKGSKVKIIPSNNNLIIEPEQESTYVAYSVGYEKKSLDDFINFLKQHNVMFLADVREVAFSRRNGFRKGPLQSALLENGIYYVGFPALGAPKKIREKLKETHDYETFFKEYKEHMLKNELHLKALLNLLKQGTTAIMCYEADYNMCHRKVIIEWLKQQGVTIKYL